MGAITAIRTLPRMLRKTMFLLRKARPEILVIGGVVTATGAFVWAVINARKMNQVMEETQQKVEAIEARRADIADDDKPSIKEWEKELNKAKAESIWKMFTLIGLPSIAFAGGMVMICGGHLILVRRFGALSSAFAALQSSFDRYRRLNIAEHGEECDRRYIAGEGLVDGKPVNVEGATAGTEPKALPKQARDGYGMYTFVFDEDTSTQWNRDPVMNIAFLRSQQNYWNARLGSGHVVTLKDVLEGLEIEVDPDDPRMDYILIAGWRPNGDGDCQIDFGINKPVNKPTIDLKENYLVLDFNCDGNLYHANRYTKDGKKIFWKDGQTAIGKGMSPGYRRRLLGGSSMPF